MPIQLPYVTSPVIDPKTGQINRDWYMALLSIAGTTTGAFVSNVNLAGLNGITVTGSPITSAGIITLGIGNLTCASAVISGGVTANSVVATVAISAANMTASGTVTAARVIVSNTLTSANIVTTGTIQPASTGGIIGTATNDSANAGSVGEYISSTVLIGAAVPVNSGASANVTSIALTAGDWDVHGNVWTNISTGTLPTALEGGISITSATLPTRPGGGASAQWAASSSGGSNIGLVVGAVRLLLSGAANVFLVASSTFTISSNTVYGFIGARRRR